MGAKKAKKNKEKNDINTNGVLYIISQGYFKQPAMVNGKC